MSDNFFRVGVLCLSISMIFGLFADRARDNRITVLENAVKESLETDVNTLKSVGMLQEGILILHRRQAVLAELVTGEAPPSLKAAREAGKAEVETF